MQVVVAGFPHSGTSLVTPLLRSAGLDMGPGPGSDSDVTAEDCEGVADPHVRGLHRAILERHGATVDDLPPSPRFIGRDHWNRMRQLVRRRDLAHDAWGFEDPTAVLFLGAWKHVMPDARFILVFRDSFSCLQDRASCRVGHGDASAGPEHGLRLWDAYNRALVAFARSRPEDCVLLPHDDLVAGRSVDGLQHRLGVTVTTHVAPAASGTASPASPPRSTTVAHAHPRTSERVEQTWDALTHLAAQTES